MSLITPVPVNPPSQPIIAKFYRQLRIISLAAQQRLFQCIICILDITPTLIDTGMRILGPILVLTAWLLFGLFAYIYFIHLMPLVDQNPWIYPYNIQTYIGLIILFLIYYNHIKATFTSPGIVTDQLPIPANINELIDNDSRIIKRGEGFSNYCKICIKPKPPRTHHCHICKNCVLKMVGDISI